MHCLDKFSMPKEGPWYRKKGTLRLATVTCRWTSLRNLNPQILLNSVLAQVAPCALLENSLLFLEALQKPQMRE